MEKITKVNTGTYYDTVQVDARKKQCCGSGSGPIENFQVEFLIRSRIQPFLHKNFKLKVVKFVIHFI